jgi:predicted nucleic acid-binding protein
MAYLIDTSVLARLANVADISYTAAVRAVMELHGRGEVLHITPQNLVEFRSVATRPTAVNGLGLSAAEATVKAAVFEAAFPLLVDSPGIYQGWKSLVEALGVIGKQVHDARLVVVCHVYGISHLLTFNGAHFTRMAAFGPGIVVVDPASV